VPALVGTSGLPGEALERLERLAQERSLQLFVVPNFAIGAVLMMRFAVEAAEYLPRAEIVELHHEGKRDAPSGTARATAERMPGDPAIHSVRLPGLVAHQEVLLGGDGQLLTIRHDTLSREAFVPGVLLALEKLPTLPPGLTIGLEKVLW
jgi:4-hydroxy-tetrahydrodipicolinate reductase